MKILGFRIGWRRPGKQRRQSAPTKLERITSSALLDAAIKDSEVLAALLNKYGQIQVHPKEDETESKLEAVRAMIQGDAIDTILGSRHQELEKRIDSIIDRFIVADDRRYAVEHNGHMVEMGTNEYRRYLRRRQERQTEKVQRYSSDFGEQSRLTGTNIAVPAPIEEGED